MPVIHSSCRKEAFAFFPDTAFHLDTFILDVPRQLLAAPSPG